ncbi:MAG: hypothetical protein H7Y04_14395 [Verrucomicrobia bacterium]|nr:hypothetical protein [Cytophagales bacterium]
MKNIINGLAVTLLLILSTSFSLKSSRLISVSRFSASLTIEGKTYVFTENVNAVGRISENKLLIGSVAIKNGDLVSFSIEVKGIDANAKDFSTAKISVGANKEAFYNNYYPDCITKKQEYTKGSITIGSFTKPKTKTIGSSGVIKGTFEGQVAVIRSVAEYKCPNRGSQNTKVTIVPVSGSFEALYVEP